MRSTILTRSRWTTLPIRRTVRHFSSGISREIYEPPAFTDIDEKWRLKWTKELSLDGSLDPGKRYPHRRKDKGKYYTLSMFPYPSGMLHMGHLRVYTISDILARFRRMHGYDVVHCMGWDAFGLPAENAAIERGIDPREWTVSNIAKMKEQMTAMHADFDWDREIATCSPEYYKWTQKLFLLMYEDGLAYRKEAEINWDPVDQTVLANEQVDQEGRSWRSGAVVEKRMLEQWFFGITKYAERLNSDLKLLENWPSRVAKMQKNWIGASEGAEVQFGIRESVGKCDPLTVFTTRPDTLFGVQFMAVALDHPLTRRFRDEIPELKQFIARAEKLPQDAKDAFQLPGVFAANPLTPDVFDIPVFVAPYVLGHYGHGAVMGCPGHDERDFAFWKLHRPGEDVEYVVEPVEEPLDTSQAYTAKKGRLRANCGEYAGLGVVEGGKAIVEALAVAQRARVCRQYRLRDWLVSRQRYWGAPIPIIHCGTCGVVPVPDKDLPVMLPEGAQFSRKGGNPLANSEEFYKVKCPKCGGDAHRDTDTMDTFVDSSWYFFRYTDAQNKQELFSYDKASHLMPVDLYLGGIEHAILHLLYSRFVAKFLADKGLWSGGDLNGEPIRKLVTQGMVHGKTYVEPGTGRFLRPHEVDTTDAENPRVVGGKYDGEVAKVSYEKMSKSKYNGADPGECIAAHGADATRAHIVFQAPVPDALNWDESKIVGVERFLKKVLTTAAAFRDGGMSGGDAEVPSQLTDTEISLWNGLQQYVSKITESFSQASSLNTVISDYMKLMNELLSYLKTSDARQGFGLFVFQRLLVLMAPVTPATCEEAWEMLHPGGQSVFWEPWPEAEPVRQSLVRKYRVIVDGKFKFLFESDLNAHKDVETLVEKVLASTKGREMFPERPVLKKVVANDKIVSLVIQK